MDAGLIERLLREAIRLVSRTLAFQQAAATKGDLVWLGLALAGLQVAAAAAAVLLILYVKA